MNDSIFAESGSTNDLVRTAPRPGVEKITFVPHATNSSGAFLPMTNHFADLYLTNSMMGTQQACRVTSRPDILFRAKDFGYLVSNDRGQPILSCPTQ